MNKTNRKNSRKIYMLKKYATAVSLMVFLFAVLLPEAVSAALTVNTFPDESNVSDIRTRNRVQLGDDNLKSWKWHGVSGEVVLDDTSGSGTPCVGFWVPVNGTTDYTDLLDIYFEDVLTTADGRKLNAQIHVNSFHSVNYGSYKPSKALVGVIYKTTKRFSALGYQNGVKIDYTLTVTYADTGEVYDRPMLHIISDVDIVRSSMPAYNESWELKSGYMGDIWKWSSFNESISGNKITATDGTNYVDNDSYLKAGAVATTNNGEFRFVATTTSGAGTVFEVSLANDNLPSPEKESDGKEINIEGDTINYMISQKIGTFYGDTMVNYKTFVISDELPEGVTYKSARVYNGAGTDITSKGTLKYDAAMRKVTFTIGSTWLADINNYNGQNITMKIATTVDKPRAPVQTIVNTGKTYIDNMTLLTNEVKDVVAIPYGVKYRYVSGTEGKLLPDSISAAKGAYKVSDSGIYYHGDTVTRKTTPAEGTKLEIKDSEGNLEGTWILSWDARMKTIDDSDVTFTGTWRYVPSPRIVIVKKLTNDHEQFTAAHGEPTFLFKITGSESGKVWYKSITFNREALEGVKTDGYYEGSDRTRFKLQDGYIYGICEAVYLPEDDYTVEEIHTARFRKTASTAAYHGAAVNTISTGSGVMTVPLKLSTYQPGDTGYDASYATVTFENIKTDWSKFSHNSIVINKTKDTD